MKKLLFVLPVIATLMCVVGCNKSETYAEQRDRENGAISKFIQDMSIKVITEAEFKKNDSTTDVSKNEYVVINNTGVYMQIVSKGCGEPVLFQERIAALNAEETVICTSLAKQFNANITMVGEKNKNLSYIDENGEEKFSNAAVVLSKGEIYISKKADINKIVKSAKESTGTV